MNYREAAIAAAKKAGEVLTKYFGQALLVSTKDREGRDLISIADRESEKIIITSLKKDFPEHNILAEESAPQNNSSEYTWIIDPLDGTNNFLRGFPIFSVSIALAKGEKVLLGVIYNPMTKELFVAERGMGSFLHEQRLRVSLRENLAQAIITQNLDNSQKQREIYLQNLSRLLQEVHGFRQFHSTALELCNVACGKTEAFIVNGGCSWDIAAGALVVEEAGGKVTSFNGSPWHWRQPLLVASNGVIHDKLLQKLSATP